MPFALTLAVAGALIVLGLTGCASLGAEKRAPKLGETIAVEGVDMHVLDQGPRDSARPPVVLIHGASVNLRDMKIALGDRLSEDRRVVMVDRPGRGYSDRPRDGHDLAAQARLIKGVVDALGVEKPVVVGQSLGGAVALNYALHFQQEMTGLVLLAPVSHEWPGGVSWYNHAATIPVLGVLFRRLIIPVYGALAAKDAIADSFAPDAPPEDYYHRAGVPLLFRSADFKANAADLANLKAEIREQQARYGEIAIPVAIAHGKADDTVSADLHARRLVREIEGASLVMLPETGHPLHHTQTETAIDLINAVSGAGA